MKKEELKDFMEIALESSKEILLKEGKLFPTAFMFVEGELHIIGLSFRNPREKDMQITLLRKFVKEKNADAAFVAIESWYATSDKKDFNIIPSKHPNRKECIFITGESEEGDITMVQLFEREGGKDEGKIIFTEKHDIGGIGYTKFNFGIKGRKKQRQRIDKKELS